MCLLSVLIKVIAAINQYCIIAKIVLNFGIMDSDTPGPSGVKLMTIRQLYNIIRGREDMNFQKKLQFLEEYLLELEPYSEIQRKKFKVKISNLKFEFKRKWLAAHRKEDVFLKNNAEWLHGAFEIPTASKPRSGRPEKSFTDSSERTKRRKTESLRDNIDTVQLTYAAQMSLRASGNPAAAKVLGDLTRSPKRASKYKKAFSDSLQKRENESLTPVQALSMFVEAGLTRKQYEIVRSTNKKIYPCYSILSKAKRECYPAPASFTVTSTCAEINLQDLLNHTSVRLILYLQEVLDRLSETECKSMTLISKWGCDGSQQTQFKQKFENVSDSDANIFQSSLVPLQLTCGTGDKKVIWQNPTPSSPRYCRPIRIRFVKETTGITTEEINYVNEQINHLHNTVIESPQKVEIKHILTFTMVDGKVCNSATDTKSTMKCFICGATSKEFNNLDLIIKRKVNESTLTFGLSILHARIRLFESILHLAYKLDVKKWQQKTSSEEKIKIQQRKKKIQDEFRRKIGIIVDVPKPGYGNSNDGNTSRRFFNDHVISSEITGIDEILIFRLKVILEAISSGHRIDTIKFSAYALETAKLYVSLYAWHPMTPTLHKILMHGAIVIEKALLPIGQLSEEASEARNKHFRSYRLQYARKFSRELCNRDIINRILLTSDPLLSSMRTMHRKKTKPFLPETLELLLPQSFINSEQCEGEADSSKNSDESSEELESDLE